MIAEKIFINGNIYTMNDDQFHAEALATDRQTILAVGSNAEVMACAGPETEVFDLEGKTVIPGIIDSHIHTLIAGDKFDTDYMVSCFDKTKDEIIEAVGEMVKKRQPGEWIQGLGWNQSGWVDTSMPTRQELDAVSPDNPVILMRVCGHAYWANSRALEAAGIDRNTETPLGSEIMKDADGEPTGYLTELAGQIVGGCVPEITKEDIARKFLIIQDYMLENGVTSYSDKDLGVSSLSEEPPVKLTMEALDDLYSMGTMKVRLNTFIAPCPLLEEMYKTGPLVGLYGGRLTHRGVKMFMDGALGARSAWMLEDYSDRPGHTGSSRIEFEFLKEQMRKAHEAGFQVSVHAIGDAAVKTAVDAHEAVNPEHKDHRFLIEHFMIAREEEFERLKNNTIIPSMQYVELSSDMNMIEARVGKERSMGAYAWRKVLNAGAKIAAGTDLPMDVLNPYENMYYGVSRCTIDEEPQGGWHPWEALTRYEVLKSYTLDAAYARFEEDKLGSLEAGKYADFVVIDKDYMNCAVKEIKDIKALMTVIGGEILYLKSGGLTIDYEIQWDKSYKLPASEWMNQIEGLWEKLIRDKEFQSEIAKLSPSLYYESICVCTKKAIEDWERNWENYVKEGKMRDFVRPRFILEGGIHIFVTHAEEVADRINDYVSDFPEKLIEKEQERILIELMEERIQRFYQKRWDILRKFGWPDSHPETEGCYHCRTPKLPRYDDKFHIVYSMEKNPQLIMEEWHKRYPETEWCRIYKEEEEKNYREVFENYQDNELFLESIYHGLAKLILNKMEMDERFTDEQRQYMAERINRSIPKIEDFISK